MARRKYVFEFIITRRSPDYRLDHPSIEHTMYHRLIDIRSPLVDHEDGNAQVNSTDYSLLGIIGALSSRWLKCTGAPSVRARLPSKYYTSLELRTSLGLVHAETSVTEIQGR